MTREEVIKAYNNFDEYKELFVQMCIGVSGENKEVEKEIFNRYYINSDPNVKRYPKTKLAEELNIEVKKMDSIIASIQTSIKKFTKFVERVNRVCDIYEYERIKREYKDSSIKNVRLEDLEMTVRNFNNLARANFRTVGDFIDTNPVYIASAFTVTPKTFDFVKDLLAMFGIHVNWNYKDMNYRDFVIYSSSYAYKREMEAIEKDVARLFNK